MRSSALRVSSSKVLSPRKLVLSLAKTSPMPPNERASAIVRATRASRVDWAAGLRLNAQTAGVIVSSHQRTPMAPVAPPSGRRRDSLAESGPFRKRNPCLQLTWPAQLAERRPRPGRVDLTANRTVNPRSSLKLVPPHQRAPRRPSLRHPALRFVRPSSGTPRSYAKSPPKRLDFYKNHTPSNIEPRNEPSLSEF